MLSIVLAVNIENAPLDCVDNSNTKRGDQTNEKGTDDTANSHT